jgi:hypothetical protein
VIIPRCIPGLHFSLGRLGGGVSLVSVLTLSRSASPGRLEGFAVNHFRFSFIRFAIRAGELTVLPLGTLSAKNPGNWR